jgi:hypothetical protein
MRMKQQTLAMAADQGAGFEQYRRPTKRDVFLETMERDKLGEQLQGCGPKVGRIPGEILMKKLLAILALAATMAHAQTTTTITDDQTVPAGATVPMTLADGAQSTTTYTVSDPETYVPLKGDGSGDGTFYYNDSTIPYFPTADGTQMVAIFGATWVSKFTGSDLFHLLPFATRDLVTIIRPANYATTNTVESGYDYNGDWMQQAVRAPDGTLVGLVHGENHWFADGIYGEWYSGLIWTSTDDGTTWTDGGVAASSPKPLVHSWGGFAIGSLFWDHVANRWIGYYMNYPLVSYDEHAAPGTWYGMDSGGNFTIHMDPTQQPVGYTTSPGLSSSYGYNHITWNSYLSKYVMTYIHNGGTVKLFAVFSDDGIHWSPEQLLYSEDTGTKMNYPQIIGDTSTTSGQDAYLVYERAPAIYTTNNNDIIVRKIHFN